MTDQIVFVHWFDTDRADPAGFHDLLTDEEAARAARFRFDRDRNRYVVRRGVLRHLLGRALGLPPQNVRFAANEYGKLSVAGSDLRFNVSHSHGIALYAIAEGVEVGCDIEKRDPHFAEEQIAEHFFSPVEVRTLRALHPARQTEAFFNCWTRKEAYIKARGYGLSLPLHSFDVSLLPGERAVLQRGCEGWTVHAFEPIPGYQAALVAQGAQWRAAIPETALSIATLSGGAVIDQAADKVATAA